MNFREMYAALMASLLLLFAVPASAQQTAAPRPMVPTADRVAVETLVRGLGHPWGLQFLPDGRMLVTERSGQLRVVDAGGKLSPPVAGVPTVFASGQGGLLDVVLDPEFSSNGQIFLSYAEPRGGGAAGTAVARGRLTLASSGGRLDDVTVIFRQVPPSGGGFHFGSRLAFGRDGHLFLTIGDRGSPMRAQDYDTHIGKVMRIDRDGQAPSDNPFVGRSGTLPEIWSIGHRNPQAAAIHPETGKLWTVEHGARGGDEINVPLAGRNYGWPRISYGREYSGARIGIGTRAEGMEQPIYYWDPSIAPSGMAFYTSDRFAEWQGNLFVGALALQHLTRLVIDGERVVAEERLIENLGERIRDVRQGPDGALYLLTDHPDGKILRLTLRSS